VRRELPGQRAARPQRARHQEPGGIFDMTGVTRGPDGIKRYDGLPRNLVHMLRASVDAHGAAEAVVETGAENAGSPRLSYAQPWDRAARVAGGLRAVGVQRGDRVAIQLGNGADWVLAFFGAVLADAIVVPVNTRFTEEEADYVVTDSGATYVFVPGAPLPDGEPLAVEDAGPADPAAIFHTSGTTGFPKGAVTSHENFLSNAETCRRALSGAIAGESLRTLISVPLFHVTGCNSQLLLAAYTGGTAVVMSAFEVGAFLRAIEQERIDVMITVPAIYWLAISRPAAGGARHTPLGPPPACAAREATEAAAGSRSNSRTDYRRSRGSRSGTGHGARAARTSHWTPPGRDRQAPAGQERAGRAAWVQASGSRVPLTAASATSVRRWLLLRA
jgi:acyl-CoA synthetase (AMP-forming)/AMP-acid ligase II